MLALIGIRRCCVTEVKRGLPDSKTCKISAWAVTNLRGAPSLAVTDSYNCTSNLHHCFGYQLEVALTFVSLMTY